MVKVMHARIEMPGPECAFYVPVPVELPVHVILIPSVKSLPAAWGEPEGRSLENLDCIIPVPVVRLRL